MYTFFSFFFFYISLFFFLFFLFLSFSLFFTQVRQTLFKERKGNSTDFKKFTREHAMTTHPKLEEKLSFNLEEVWPERLAREFRLYICFMANRPVATDGTGFLGCFSIALEEIFARPSEEMVPWYWLLSKNSGWFI